MATAMTRLALVGLAVLAALFVATDASCLGTFCAVKQAVVAAGGTGREGDATMDAVHFEQARLRTGLHEAELPEPNVADIPADFLSAQIGKESSGDRAAARSTARATKKRVDGAASSVRHTAQRAADGVTEATAKAQEESRLATKARVQQLRDRAAAEEQEELLAAARRSKDRVEEGQADIIHSTEAKLDRKRFRELQQDTSKGIASIEETQKNEEMLANQAAHFKKLKDMERRNFDRDAKKAHFDEMSKYLTQLKDDKDGFHEDFARVANQIEQQHEMRQSGRDMDHLEHDLDHALDHHQQEAEQTRDLTKMAQRNGLAEQEMTRKVEGDATSEIFRQMHESEEEARQKGIREAQRHGQERSHAFSQERVTNANLGLDFEHLDSVIVDTGAKISAQNAKQLSVESLQVNGDRTSSAWDVSHRTTLRGLDNARERMQKRIDADAVRRQRRQAAKDLAANALNEANDEAVSGYKARGDALHAKYREQVMALQQAHEAAADWDRNELNLAREVKDEGHMLAGTASHVDDRFLQDEKRVEDNVDLRDYKVDFYKPGEHTIEVVHKPQDQIPANANALNAMA